MGDIGPQELLERARLMLVLPLRADAEDVVRRALTGGVDAVQLRDPSASADELVRLARRLRALCDERDALLVVSGDPALARQAGADAVHLESPRSSPPDLLTGRSVSTSAELDDPKADYLFVGPIWPTPTKPGHTPVGLELVREAARRSPVPFFAVGGIDPTNVKAVVTAGARRVAVVRAVADAPDPEAASRELRAALTARTRDRGSARSRR